MRSIFSGAYVVGALLGLTLTAKYGFRPVYLGVTVIMLAVGIIGRWGRRPARPEARRQASARPQGVVVTVRGARLPGRVWLLLGVILALGTVTQMYSIGISLHVTKNLGRSADLVGWIVGLTALVEIPMMIATGRAAGGWSARRRCWRSCRTA